MSSNNTVDPDYQGPNYRDYLRDEQAQVPAHMLEDSYRPVEPGVITTDKYISQDFFALEAKKMWPRVWQMVCREEDIPGAGDYIVYELLDWSFLVTRTEQGDIKGFYNTCLHRGRKLKTKSGCSNKFVCPYHAFSWNIDGSLDSIPCEWDFKHAEDFRLNLPEVRVERWAGFVFINMDDKAKPLTDYLGVLPQHFKRWKVEDCYKVVHVSKVIAANWKVVQEAFMESYHVHATHPQLSPFTGDINASYDIWGDHVNRSINPMAVPSPYELEKRPPEQQAIFNELMKSGGRFDAENTLAIPAGMTARRFVADLNREHFSSEDGFDYSAATDSEMVDAFIYNVFPNLSPWGGYLPNVVYRFLPYGNDVNTSTMEVMILKRVADKSSMGRACDITRLGIDQPWADAKELGGLAEILEQDMVNIPHVQTGMKAFKDNKLILSNYQEVRIRHFHETLEKYLEI